MMEVTPIVQRLIMAGASTQEIKAEALKNRRTMREDGILKVRQGLTTPEEVIRMTTA
jgi:type IV pilus assembly protein PilB